MHVNDNDNGQIGNRRTGEQAAKFSYRDVVFEDKRFYGFYFGDQNILLLLLVNFWVG